MKIIQFLLTCVVLFFTVSFAVSNKQPFPLKLWPFPFEITLPVSFIVLAFGLLFFILGGGYAWFLTIPVRNDRWKQSRKIKDLSKELDEIRKNQSND